MGVSYIQRQAESAIFYTTIIYKCQSHSSSGVKKPTTWKDPSQIPPPSGQPVGWHNDRKAMDCSVLTTSPEGRPIWKNALCSAGQSVHAFSYVVPPALSSKITAQTRRWSYPSFFLPLPTAGNLCNSPQKEWSAGYHRTLCSGLHWVGFRGRKNHVDLMI